MLLLRLTQYASDDGRHRLELALEGNGARQTAAAEFAWQPPAQDDEDLRWYLEDYLQSPQDPAPIIARRIEGRIADLGVELFRAIFQASEDTRDLWATLRERLSTTRIEVVTRVAEATTLPWELLRDPKTDLPLALTAAAFVRAQPDAARRPLFPDGKKKGPIRVLLVICRPRAEQDVPFRSVASRLILGLDTAPREVCELDVLRPPTFEQLGRVLRQAGGEGRPYHVVHFDGHGGFLAAEPGILRRFLQLLPPRVMSGRPREGKHGYLLFENPALPDNAQLIDGPQLGALLRECQVPVLVLNSCRSAYAEPKSQPERAAAPGAADPHSQVRAIGSLAQEVMDAGAAGVVATRYNIYVDTAASLAASLYASLAQGLTLGESVTLARKQLADSPLRQVTAGPLPLQDWSVPVVWEAAPLRLFPKRRGQRTRPRPTPDPAGLDPDLPPPPDAGFWGRDETLLALDRAFDRDSVVLLHAYAGSGKTATAAEFARWYVKTHGVAGPVLFNTFERYLPLTRALDHLGEVFEPVLEKSGIPWPALNDRQRRQAALQLLRQEEVLWIWDNVEPVAGFPAGTESAWTTAEQRELADFLRAALATKAKFLLTSRRAEEGWLGALPTRVTVPAMPMTERLQLTRALADKWNRRLPATDWRPLLVFTQGNPLALTVLVGQALREGLESAEQVESFLARLRSGEQQLPDAEEEGRPRSLEVSLAYGFAQAFTEAERRRLSLLSLFQGFVNVEGLRLMGAVESDWCLAEVRGLTRQEGIALLDRAADVGLLVRQGGGSYGIHPALPWFFRSLFAQSWPDGGLPAVRAFVEATAELANSYCNQYEWGDRRFLAELRAEEANLLHARRLGRRHGWWEGVLRTMQGLRQLYGHQGWRGEWKRLVEEIVPDFVDSATGGPVAGREEYWGVVTEYRVVEAYQEQRWADAERLQLARVDWERRRSSSALALPRQELKGDPRIRVLNLGASLYELAELWRQLEKRECVALYREALELAASLGETSREAVCAFGLGHAYKNLPGLRDVNQAETWYRRSLELHGKGDPKARGQCFIALGNIARERFWEARKAKRSQAELLALLDQAVAHYQKALEILPTDGVDDLAITHNQLGWAYQSSGDVDRALSHYRKAIEYHEAQGDLHGAAGARFNVAGALLPVGRRQDALEYAQAALRGFETYGDQAAEWIRKTRKLIEEIRQAGGSA